MIPEILQNPTDSFAPQMLRVGDTMQLNNSVFKFTIAEAFDVVDKTQPVSSFSYSNNPTSQGCDVTNMTADYAVSDSSLELTVAITCHIPTLFTLTWSGKWAQMSSPFPWGTSPAQQDLNGLAFDLVFGLIVWIAGTPTLNGDKISSLRVTVQPCCDCDKDPLGRKSLPKPVPMPTSSGSFPCDSNLRRNSKQ
ncbi:hypothetical protein C8J57DRAFT_164277 [Mycena rebaudengoi]|nr:hypothetical protein C8J57DRAFT_164277 [Mycena rebaudengoi]